MIVSEIKCPDCAEMIKAEARVCKHCGYRFGDTKPESVEPQGSVPEEQWSIGWIIGGGCALAAACAGLIALSLHATDEAFRTDSPELEEIAKSYIKNTFNDPESAQFTELHSDDKCVTGKVNAKNRLGGYVGAEDFYYNARTNSGRLSPGMPRATDLSIDYDTRSKDFQDFNYESSVCRLGKEEADKNVAEVKRIIAEQKRGSR